ncbi:MAG TPA: hypothetical protein PK883_00400 [Anaerolineaceae bacterium]|nr:hypothetical protein [Anaerolineaceae bacterium]
MKMVKINKGGITMSVPEADVDFYKRAGYEMVEPEKPGPEPEIAEKSNLLPVEEKAPRSRKAKIVDKE